MKDLMEKLSSYNLFNNLLPGAVFSFIVKNIREVALVSDNVFLAFFMYYFIGVTIGRIGSLIIEPLLKKIRIVKFKPYSEFILAADKDSKLEILSEANNMYRSFISLIFTISIIEGYKYIIEKFDISEMLNGEIIVFLLILLYIFSYRKQTNYISERIETRLNKKEEK